MASGLVALLDDIAGLTRLAAASLDDVAGAAAKAGTKAAGVVVDDTAVTPRYVVGLSPKRELPIIGKIALGSLRNAGFLTYDDGFAPAQLAVVVTGDARDGNRSAIVARFAAALDGRSAGAVLAGLMRTYSQAVNMVNAPSMARDRNIEVAEVRHERDTDYQTLVRVRVRTTGGERSVAGTLFGTDKPRLVEIYGIKVEADFAPRMLFIINEDKPGFIGAFASLLGDAKINIATFHLGRVKQGGDAIALVEIDGVVGRACGTPVRAGMVVRTQTNAARAARMIRSLGELSGLEFVARIGIERVEPAERHVDGALIFGRAALDHGPIGLRDLAVLEQQPERGGRLAVTPQDQAAGGVLVQPVHDALALRCPAGGDVHPETRQGPDHGGPVPAGAGVGGDPGGLVHHDDVGVLVHDGEPVHDLRDHARVLLGLRHPGGDDGAGRDLQGFGGLQLPSLVPHAHPVLLAPGGRGTAGTTRFPGQQRIQAGAVVLVAHRELDGLLSAHGRVSSGCSAAARPSSAGARVPDSGDRPSSGTPRRVSTAMTAMDTQMQESAMLKIAKCGTEMKSTTCPRPKPGSRKSRSVRLPSTPASRPARLSSQAALRARGNSRITTTATAACTRVNTQVTDSPRENAAPGLRRKRHHSRSGITVIRWPSTMWATTHALLAWSAA